MKALIATACAAVIAATGYYFIQEYRAHAEAQRVADIASWRRICDRVGAGEFNGTKVAFNVLADECIRRKGQGEF